MTNRCGPCNKSKHYLCNGKGCGCKCRDFEDTVQNREEPERLSDPAYDDLIDTINEEYRADHS